jgi:hypothetical protein
MSTYRIPRAWVFGNLIGTDAKSVRWAGAGRAMAADVSEAMARHPDGHLVPVDRSLDEAPSLADRLRDFLRARNLSEDEIEHALWLLDGGIGEDDPPDAAYGGEPRPGGSMTPLRPDGSGNTQTELTRRPAMDARSMAMDAAMRVGIDGPLPSPGSYSVDASTAELADFAARWPTISGIKVM